MPPTKSPLRLARAQLDARCWDLQHWPQETYPHTPSRAEYILRVHKKSLITCGALTRCGRDWVIFAAPYLRWLSRQSSKLLDFPVPPNNNSKPHPEAEGLQ